MKELRVMYLKNFQYLLTFSLFILFLLPFSTIFVFVFPIEIKMRGVYMGDNERIREIENVFFLFFLPPSIFFFEREIKKKVCVCGSGDGKELEKWREYFFFGS